MDMGLVSTEKIREMFAAISPTYDRLNRVLSFGLDGGWRRSVLRAFPFRRGRILDVCTGTGELALLLARDGFGVVGLDICPPMLDLARRKRANVPDLTFVEGDAHALPFSDQAFQGVTNAFSLRNLPDLDRVFRESHRVIVPRGVAVFLELTRPARWLSPVYDLYLRWGLPAVGQLISGNRNAYAYLARSIQAFPSRERIEERLRAAGFRHVSTRLLSAGAATLWSALK